MEIISKVRAREQGLERYYTGKHCNRGHLSERYTNSGHCIECHRKKRDEWKAANRERVREKDAKWYRENRDLVRERARVWAKENKKRVAENNRKWAENNREKRSASARARHAKNANAEGVHTAEDIFQLLERQGSRCAICNVRVGSVRGKEYHVDHIYPLSKGGSNWPENLQILCVTCNLRKHAKDPIEYAQELGRLI